MACVYACACACVRSCAVLRGTVNVRNRTCKSLGCHRQACFGTAEEKFRIYCKRHKYDSCLFIASIMSCAQCVFSASVLQCHILAKNHTHTYTRTHTPTRTHIHAHMNAHALTHTHPRTRTLHQNALVYTNTYDRYCSTCAKSIFYDRSVHPHFPSCAP